MKKLIATLLTLVLLLSLCAPAFAEAAHTITSEAYPVYKEAEPLGGDLTLYFLDGVKDLPYLEINTWMNWQYIPSPRKTLKRHRQNWKPYPCAQSLFGSFPLETWKEVA